MQTVEIELSKKRLILLFLSSLGFVAVGFWFVFSPPVMEDSFLGHPAALAAIGAITILLFGLAAILIGRKIPDTSPGLIITNEGITDNSSGTSIGFIAWKDIIAINSKLIGSQTFILITVNNPQDYINRTTSKIKKKVYQSTYKTHGTPLTISAIALAIKTPELVKLLQDQLSAFEELEQKDTN